MDKCPTEMRDEELWQLFPIILVPYDTSWPEAYRSESLRLREAVGSDIVRISHIGSTAVPGLTAKPTIDILLEIEPDTYLPTCLPSAASKGRPNTCTSDTPATGMNSISVTTCASM